MKVNNIAKNTSFLTMALILQKVMSFTYFTILARNLDPDVLGKYYFAISFTTIFSIITDFGLINVTTREIAKDHEGANKFLSGILFLKIPMAILALTAVFISINSLNKGDFVVNLVYISSICMVLDSFTSTFWGVLRGFHNLVFESFGAVFFQIVVMVFGLSALYTGKSLFVIMFALALASIFNFCFSSFILVTKLKMKLVPKYRPEFFKKIIKLAIPFGLFAVFQRTYMYLDSVLLSFFAGDWHVGLYQIAFKIVFALQFLPMAFTASLYPAMSSYWLHNREQLKITFERALSYLIIISLPISFGVASIADKIVTVFKPEYIESTLPIQIIMMSLLFIFINFPIGALLNACDKQKTNTINMAITMTVSIVLNFILIPKYQSVGASITVLITNALMFGLGIIHVGKITKYRPKVILKTFLKAFASIILMVLVVLFLKHSLNIFLVVMFGGLVYFSSLFLFKGFRREDVISVYNSFRKK